MEANAERRDACPCGSGKARAKCHGESPIDVRDPDAQTSYQCIFGFPEFQESFYTGYKEYFLQVLPKVRLLAMEILRKAVPDVGVQAAVHALATVAFSTHLEVVLLAGNGLGFGAAKGARSILECLFIVEYLIKHPEEAERHRATGQGRFWRILEKAKQQGFDLGRFQLNEEEMEEGYGAARERVGSREWNIEKIAKEIGREAEYDTIYRLLSELVHSGHLGVSFRAVKPPGSDWPAIGLGASGEWCDISLYLSHKFLITALGAVNHLFGLDYAERLDAALSDLEKAWQRQ